jgi:hypothetical protein
MLFGLFRSPFTLFPQPLKLGPVRIVGGKRKLSWLVAL